MSLCLKCFGSHRLTPLDCRGDAKHLATEWAAGRTLADHESWVLGFADRPEEHLTDDECRWFRHLLAHGSAHAEAILGYARYGRMAKVASAELTGHHVGTVDERRLFSVKVVRITELEPGEYGRRFLCLMHDPAGNHIVWFTGENLAFHEGEEHTVRARVEKHGDFNGRRQTLVSRVKAVSDAV